MICYLILTSDQSKKSNECFENSHCCVKPTCPPFDLLHLAERKDDETTYHHLSVGPGGFWAVSLRHCNFDAIVRVARALVIFFFIVVQVQ